MGLGSFLTCESAILESGTRILGWFCAKLNAEAGAAAVLMYDGNTPPKHHRHHTKGGGRRGCRDKTPDYDLMLRLILSIPEGRGGCQN